MKFTSALVTQEMNELLAIEKHKIDSEEILAIDARKLHEFLEVKKQFTDWIRPKIKDYGFLINSDFYRSKCIAENGRKMETYIFTLESAAMIASRTRTPRGSEAHNFFCNKLGEHVVIKYYGRLEIQFGEKIINNLFSEYKIIHQKSVLGGKYYIDWYIPELNLAIEFDEPYHFYNKNKDNQRQKEIEMELGCKFARYCM